MADTIAEKPEPNSCITCQKQAKTPTKNTVPMIPFRIGLASKIGRTFGSARNAPNPARISTTHIVRI